MEVAKLVEQRKLGQITQEEFFIRLNEVRRASITARINRAHDDFDDEKQPEQNTTLFKAIDQPSQEPGGKTYRIEARDIDVVDGMVDELLLPPAGVEIHTAGLSQDPEVGQQSSLVDQLLLDEVELGIPTACAEANSSDLVCRQEQDAGRVWDYGLDRSSTVDHESSLMVPQSRVVSPTSQNSLPTPTTQTPPAPRHIPSSVSEDAEVLVGDGRRFRRLISPKEFDQEEYSDWLATPIGETQCPSRVRKKCASSHGTCLRSSKSKGAREGKVRDSTDCSGVSPQRSRRLNGQAESRRWIPAGAGSPRPWPGNTQGSIEQTVPRPFVLSTASRNPPSINVQTRRQGCGGNRPLDPHPSRRENTALEQSPGMSKLEEARWRALISSNRHCKARWDTWQGSGAIPTARQSEQARKNFNCVDDDMSVCSLPPETTHMRGRQPRSRHHQERPKRCSSTSRRVSSRDRVEGIERGWSVDRHQPSSRDRYGYPLHERGGLGTMDERACNGGNVLFAPMIKGLPKFYQTRPRRTVDRLGGGRGELCTSTTNKEQGDLLYERSTRWLAKADNDRACKLAMREEQEMDACTFQPNVRRKSTTSYRSDRPRAATVGSSHSKMISGSEHSRHSGQGEEGQGSSQHSAGRATRDHRRSSTSVEVGQRLFLESRRLKERRFEGEERKRMAEEEAYARSCTFKPCLVEGSATPSAQVRSRYRDVPPPSTFRAEQHEEEVLTFQPQILGLQPGMVRAREYVSLDVSERLHMLHRRQQTRRTKAVVTSGASTQESAEVSLQAADGNRNKLSEEERGLGNPLDFPAAGGGDEESISRSDGPESEGGSMYIEEGDGREPRETKTRRGRGGRRCHSDVCSTDKREGHGEQEPSSIHIISGISRPNKQRPRSAPLPRVGSRDQRGETEWDWARKGRQRDRPKPGGESARSGSRWLWPAGWESRNCNKDRTGSVGKRPRRQNSISFGEFLTRQVHSQAVARQRLGRLTRMHSPSFSPQLSEGSRRIVAKNGAASFGGGGSFEDRLKIMARRRQRDRTVAAKTAVKLEQKECTFSPELTSRARVARARTVRELSIGDAALRLAKQRMAKAREDTRLLEEVDEGQAGFHPRLETQGDVLAPLASSRLRLADELDTYIERVQNEAKGREEEHSRQRQNALLEEQRACTFHPMLTECPDLVRRTAQGMRRIREFRARENPHQVSPSSSSSSRPQWR